MSRFRPYTSLGGERAAFNTFQAWPVSMLALPPRLQHHRIFRIGITSLLTVPSIAVHRGTFRVSRAGTGGVRIGVKGRARFRLW